MVQVLVRESPVDFRAENSAWRKRRADTCSVGIIRQVSNSVSERRNVFVKPNDQSELACFGIARKRPHEMKPQNEFLELTFKFSTLNHEPDSMAGNF